MKLTYEEFGKLPIRYLQGMTFDWGAVRMYCNEQYGIYKETNTKRVRKGDIYSGWREGKVAFYMHNDERLFDTPRELYEAVFLTPWFTEGRPVRDGWYETDRGMLFFELHTGQWFRDPVVSIPVLSPLKWRGMQDVQEVKPQPIGEQK